MEPKGYRETAGWIQREPKDGSLKPRVEPLAQVQQEASPKEPQGFQGMPKRNKGLPDVEKDQNTTSTRSQIMRILVLVTK